MKNYQTLFLDRDGVINQRIPGDYIKTVSEFQFLPGALEAIVEFSKYFKHIFVVTNQQGIGKGLMTAAQLDAVHHHMLVAIDKAGGRIDQVYYCPELAIHNPNCRKPNPGMAQQAKADFPEIEFETSLMVGDSISDMEFGVNLGMGTVFIEGKGEDPEKLDQLPIDFRLDGLGELAELIKSHQAKA